MNRRHLLSRPSTASPTDLPTLDGAPAAAPNCEIWLAAQSHLDTAWLWTWGETVEKARSSFRVALAHIARFAGCTFTQSQAQLHAWVAEHDPALFARVQDAVQHERWIVVGGMWVEPDTNLPCGEMLARQILVGQRWFERNLGRRARVGWLLDSFGFSAQLPQLLRQGGLDFFLTTKLLWNDTTTFAPNVFWWTALDGTAVLAYQTPAVLGPKNLVGLMIDLKRFLRQNPVRRVLLLYGEGDGGNGPRPDEVLHVQMMGALSRRGLLPPIEQGGPQGWFESVAADHPPIPAVQGELYLEYHRGTYTTDARGKRLNRLCEDALLGAECFATVAHLLGQDYPRDALDSTWRQMLLLQSHDSIAGTVVPEAQREAHEAFENVLRDSHSIRDSALAAIGGRVDTRGDGTPLLVFNAMSWARTDIAVADAGDFPEDFRLFDIEGHDVPWQRLGEGGVAFLARRVPAMGHSIVRIGEGSPAPAETNLLDERDDVLVVETPCLRVGIDWCSGHLLWLQDRRADDREVLDGEGNVLQLFRDRPRMWDAWNIEANDLRKPLAELRRAQSVRVADNGPLFTTVLVRKKHGRTRVEQRIIIHRHLPRIDFQTTIDWFEAHRLLKVAFPVRVRSGMATFEVPFGHVQRSTGCATAKERAQFEVPHLRWFDLSHEGYGVSLLNDGKYGCDAKGSVMRLSLLRAPSFPSRRFPSLVPWLRPTRTTDGGRHTCTFALLPHSGDWREAETLRHAAGLNSPLLVRRVEPHPGDVAPCRGLLAVDSPAVVAVAARVADGGGAIVVRLYESQGRDVRTALQLCVPVLEGREANLLEEPGDLVDLQGLSFRAHEIKTLRLVLRPPP